MKGLKVVSILACMMMILSSCKNGADNIDGVANGLGEGLVEVTLHSVSAYIDPFNDVPKESESSAEVVLLSVDVTVENVSNEDIIICTQFTGNLTNEAMKSGKPIIYFKIMDNPTRYDSSDIGGFNIGSHLEGKALIPGECVKGTLTFEASRAFDSLTLQAYLHQDTYTKITEEINISRSDVSNIDEPVDTQKAY